MLRTAEPWLHASALELIKLPAKVAEERDAARRELDEQALLERSEQLGAAVPVPDGQLTFKGILKAHAAAELVKPWQHSTLKSVGVSAHADTEKNNTPRQTQKHKLPARSSR